MAKYKRTVERAACRAIKISVKIEIRSLESPTDQKFATMVSLHNPSTLSVISVVVLVLYSAGSPANTCTATSVPPNLMTGLNLGKLSSVSKPPLY